MSLSERRGGRGVAGWAWGEAGPAGERERGEEKKVGWAERTRGETKSLFFKLKQHLNKFNLNSNKLKFGCYKCFMRQITLGSKHFKGYFF